MYRGLWINSVFAKQDIVCDFCRKTIAKNTIYRVVLYEEQKYVFCINCAIMFSDIFISKIERQLKRKKEKERKS